MFFFRHPKPVVDPRPVAEQSVQFQQRALPVLVAPQAKSQRAEGAVAVSPAATRAAKPQP